MAPIDRPSYISIEAWEIMLAVYYNYEKTDSKAFYDFSKFSFPHEDLIKYCEELHENGFVFLEHDSDGTMYLYMLPAILGCVQLDR